MIKHSEEVKSVGAVEHEGGEAFSIITVEYRTASGITKVLRLRESDASWLASALGDALELRPQENASARFAASIRAGR